MKQKNDSFLEDFFWWVDFEERYDQVNTYLFFHEDFDSLFNFREFNNESFLDGIERIFRNDCSGFYEETLLAYSFLYENLFIDDDGDLNEVQAYLLKYMKILNPDDYLYVRHNTLLGHLQGTELDAKAFTKKQYLFSFADEAFLFPEDDSIETNHTWSLFGLNKGRNILGSRRFIKVRWRVWAAPSIRFKGFMDDDLYYNGVDSEWEKELFIKQTKEIRRKYKIKKYFRKDYLQLLRERSRDKIKYHVLYKKKVGVKFTKREAREIKRIKRERKLQRRPESRDPELYSLWKSLNEKAKLPSEKPIKPRPPRELREFFFFYDKNETEFFNPKKKLEDFLLEAEREKSDEEYTQLKKNLGTSSYYEDYDDTEFFNPHSRD